MVTSLTSSLFLHWTTTPPTDSVSPSPSTSSSSSAAAAAGPSTSSSRLPNPDRQTTELLHNLAQYVHSLAQGKIGSGFDVSAAVHGSQTYRRFAVECLGDLLERGTAPVSPFEGLVTEGLPASNADGERCVLPQVPAEELLSILSPAKNPKWTDSTTAGSVTPFSLPPHTLLLLADVDAGSNTPSMVGKVMQWKKAQPEEAERVWNELARANEGLRDVCGELSEAAKGDGEGYVAEVTRLTGLPVREVSQLTVESRGIADRC
jgi:phosphomevalonate kinase